jgi:hypothetical protein
MTSDSTHAGLIVSEAVSNAEQKHGTHGDAAACSDADDGVEPLRVSLNLALLSNLARLLQENVRRATHIKQGIPYEGAFTGADIVVRRRGTLARACS